MYYLTSPLFNIILGNCVRVPGESAPALAAKIPRPDCCTTFQILYLTSSTLSNTYIIDLFSCFYHENISLQYLGRQNVLDTLMSPISQKSVFAVCCPLLLFPGNFQIWTSFCFRFCFFKFT